MTKGLIQLRNGMHQRAILRRPFRIKFMLFLSSDKAFGESSQLWEGRSISAAKLVAYRLRGLMHE
jgi:hypothetical protein